jgi:lysophospholipase L1-like esterase
MRMTSNGICGLVLGVLTFWQADTGAAAQSLAWKDPRVAFVGDSITEHWVQYRRQFFLDNRYVASGIGGNTSTQILARFQKDVVSLSPKAILIIAGSADISGIGGPITDQQIIDNLAAMVEMARAEKIKVVVGSLPPANGFGSSPGLKPQHRIMALNDRIKAWAAEQGVVYADFWSAIALPDGRTNPDDFEDQQHPSAAGYRVMEPIAQTAIAQALSSEH